MRLAEKPRARQAKQKNNPLTELDKPQQGKTGLAAAMPL